MSSIQQYASIFVLFVTAVIVRADEAYFIGIGDVSGSPFASQAFAISPDGATAVGSGSSSGQQFNEGLVWSFESGAFSLGENVICNSVSSLGSHIVGEFQAGSNTEAFVWTQQTGIVGLGYLSTGNPPVSSARAVSSDGSTIVGLSRSALSSPGYEPVAWINQVIKSLGGLPLSDHNRGSAEAVSNNGLTIVGGVESNASGPNSTEAFIWTFENGMKGLGALSQTPFLSCANGVSNDGLTVVGFSSSGNTGSVEAFRWRAETGMVGLGYLSGGYDLSQATCVSGDGDVVAGLSYGPFPHCGAMIWTKESGIQSVYDLIYYTYGIHDIQGWALYTVYGISEDGQTIAGAGRNPQGFDEGWVAFIPRPNNQCPGDTNGDRVVDLSDLALLLSQFGEQTGGLQGDLNSDGIVDLQDLATLLAVFGTTCP